MSQLLEHGFELTNLPRARTFEQSSMQENIAERSGIITGHCPICEHEGAQDLLKAPDRFHGRPQLYQLLRCPSCSLVWTDDPPPPEEMHLHYGPDYERLIAAAGENSPERWQIHRRNLAQYKSGGALLDLGCSTGSFLASLKGEPWNLFGIEISPDCAKRAEANTGAQVFAGDILAAPFPPESFDAITCFDVFEHVYNPRQVMERVWQWLKPGGIFYAFMPNIDSAGARVFRSYWFALELPRHLYHFSPASLRLLAKRVGFCELSITTQRALFIEYSTHYIGDEILRRLGLPRAPLAAAKEPSILWRIIRKALRLTLFPLLSLMAVVVGDGECMYAILRKEAPRPVSGQDG